ncbi:hypothetical protein ACFL27_16635 [candidate division CSSED10-310 bacterium]|uniref:Outer membrane protein beta-barrel domain-containing protein n=1 Tax=candidate division CSSED10-310 bacterium TaxID=2855610 RepID=A0ABV6Z055_UNCC1
MIDKSRHIFLLISFNIVLLCVSNVSQASQYVGFYLGNYLYESAIRDQTEKSNIFGLEYSRAIFSKYNLNISGRVLTWRKRPLRIRPHYFEIKQSMVEISISRSAFTGYFGTYSFNQGLTLKRIRPYCEIGCSFMSGKMTFSQETNTTEDGYLVTLGLHYGLRLELTFTRNIYFILRTRYHLSGLPLQNSGSDHSDDNQAAISNYNYSGMEISAALRFILFAFS